MKYSIMKDLDRVSFHDSKIEKILREGNSIKITFDWSKVANCIEFNEKNGIVTKRCVFLIDEVEDEVFHLYDDELKSWLIKKNLPDFDANFTEIGEVKIENQVFIFSGAYRPDNNYYWIEWHIQFKNLNLSWDQHCSYDEWKRKA